MRCDEMSCNAGVVVYGHEMPGFSMWCAAGGVLTGTDWSGQEGIGVVLHGRMGVELSGNVVTGTDGQAGLGLARRGVARSGKAGVDRHEDAWFGMARQDWRGTDRNGEARSGKAGGSDRRAKNKPKGKNQSGE